MRLGAIRAGAGDKQPEVAAVPFQSNDSVGSFYQQHDPLAGRGRTGAGRPLTAKVHPISIPVVVGNSSLIVRGKFAKFTKIGFECDVDHVIYGKLPAQGPAKPVLEVPYFPPNYMEDWAAKVRTRLREKDGREPSDDEVVEAMWGQMNGYTVGNEVILGLNWPKKTDKGWQFQASYSSPTLAGWTPLDEQEEEIIAVIESGEYLDTKKYAEWGPREGAALDEDFVPSWPAATLALVANSVPLIVRVRLIELAEPWGKWRIVGVLKGKPDNDVVTLDHELFGLRAEAVARHRARQDGTPPGQIAAVTKRVFDRLLGRELVTGKEAILFLRPAERPAEGVQFRLLERSYDDPPQSRLDDLEQAIKHAIAHPGSDEPIVP